MSLLRAEIEIATATVKAFVAKYDQTAGFVARHIVSNAVPGGVIVGDMIESTLNLAPEDGNETAKQMI